MNNQNQSFNLSIPILLALAMSVGIYAGFKYFSPSSSLDYTVKQNNLKIKEVLHLINDQYVDEVDLEKLSDKAVKSLLSKLDPHSVYIPATEREMSEISFESNYEGIGIEFNIFNDTLRVIAALSGGPSEELGILPGDKIIEIDSQNVAGIGLETRMVFDKLRGPKGSEVHIRILRSGAKGALDFEIIRDRIPSYTVNAKYMLNENIGYIKISRFSQNTASEVRTALKDLVDQGMSKLILDLRNNSGGILSSALMVVDEFIAEDKLILYTKGKNPSNTFSYNSRYPGLFESGEMAVLINEGSASASEIVAGALQDYDRAIIIGRRSFGKGLVQSSFDLQDGSEFRMTISRYFIPSGRSIQKPYENGRMAYMEDLYERYLSGEYFHSDSIEVADTLIFKTENGRTVYGGGGIIPDIFTPRDTSYFTSYLSNLNRKGILNEFGFQYANEMRDELNSYSLESFVLNFEINKMILDELKTKSQKAEIEVSANEFNRSLPAIKYQLKALIARNIWKDNGYYKVYNEFDPVMNSAVKAIENDQFSFNTLNSDV